jgi:hypothetical protein
LARAPDVPFNPLAMQRYRNRKAAIEARVADGEITKEQGRAQLVMFVEELMRRRGTRSELPQRTEPKN